MLRAGVLSRSQMLSEHLHRIAKADKVSFQTIACAVLAGITAQPSGKGNSLARVLMSAMSCWCPSSIGSMPRLRRMKDADLPMSATGRANRTGVPKMPAPLLAAGWPGFLRGAKSFNPEHFTTDLEGVDMFCNRSP